VTGAAQTCSSLAGAVSVPKTLWGSLEPGDQLLGVSAALPDDRDSTDYTGNNLPGSTRPLFSSVDVENGWVFTSYASGFRIYNTVVTGLPLMVGSGDIRTSGCTPSNFFAVTPECTEIKHFFWDIDAPSGKDDIIAMSGLQPVGMTIISTANKAQPALLYQDTGRGSETNGTQVYAATISGRDYAFLATNTGKQGLHLYDMTAARSLSRCSEDSATGPIQCPGVYKRRISDDKMAVYVDGTATSSGKHYIVFGSGGFGQDKGIEIWDVSNPNSPTNVQSAGGRFLAGGSDPISYGVALWEQASRQYLATHIEGGARIYDITNCLASGCSSLGTPIRSLSWADYGKAPSAVRLFVTFSRSGSTPFLHFGAADQCSGGRQREFVFNVSNASNPEEITPKGTITIDGKTIDYWGWYYAGNYYGGNGNSDPNKHGFSRVTPSVAKFGGNVLYRAASTIFDAHTWTQATPTPPNADFSWTPVAPIYPGDLVNFNDASTGGTANVWAWTFQDGTPAAASSQNVTGVTLNPSFTPGQQPPFKDVQVSHDAINGVGNTTKTKSVRVLSPHPNIGGVGRDVANTPLTCQAITFTANDVTGKPAPSIEWVVKQSGDTVFGPASGTTFTVPGSQLQAGSYTAVATASQGGQNAMQATNDFTLVDPPAVVLGGGPICTNCTVGEPPFGVVQLNIAVTGATDYAWDFGDGVFRGYTNGESQYNTATPSFSYSSTGQRTIQVKVKNCKPGSEQTSTSITVNISKIDPVAILAFSADGCAISFCPFQVNKPVTFTQLFSGAPTQYQYDWDGNGTVDQTSATPVTTHTYTATGIVKPTLTVTRGTEPPVSKTHSEISIETGTPPPTPSISVSGSGGNINTALSFTASASSCTPGSSGWTWTTDGGTGSSTSNTISITWATAGSKTVSVTNSGCSGAKGTRTVTITTPNTTTLAASFTFSPSIPKAGDTITFDGSGSTGAPTGYSWDFGGGVIKSGTQVTHVFTTPGPHDVKLEVSKAGSCLGGFCTATTSKQVVVTGGPPPLAASFSSDVCHVELNFILCNAATGQEATFTDASTGNVTSRSWDFGDGETATGTPVKHTYKKAGNYQLVLTVSDGTQSGSVTTTVVVTGGPLTEAMLLPWIGKAADGPLLQTSDLYLHNPSTSESMDVKLEFVQRGNVGTLPPVNRTIAPNATLFVSDVVKSLFGLDNMTGFLAVNITRGSVQPVLMSFNTTFRNGTEFGQTIPGFVQSNTGAAATTGNNQVQHLVGLNDNGERLAYFGFSNPSDSPVTYTLRFFNNQGTAVGTSETITLGRLGAKQFQSKEIRTRFGLNDQDDYRVVVETPRNAQLFPYGANVRLGSADPSFVTVGSGASRVFLLGALSTPGANNSIWRSDLLLANTGNQVAITEITYTNVGPTSEPTGLIKETLQPGETRRLEDVIGTKWNIRNGVGVLTIDSDAPGDQFPVIQGESYENTNPAKRYGQTLPALTEAQAAGPGQRQFLVGLREDAKYRTTFWLFNPSTSTGQYDLIFRNLDGGEIGRTSNFVIGAGKMRQLNKAQFPAGLDGAFTVQVIVKQGKVLAAAQVVNNVTNDPAYVQGETR
jgi:PKD repeat protein